MPPPDEATRDALVALWTPVEREFNSVTAFTLGRMGARVDTYIGSRGDRRVASTCPSLPCRTTEQAAAQAALAVQEFEVALGRVLGVRTGIAVHHLVREGGLTKRKNWTPP
jgi:hypothetical protein